MRFLTVGVLIPCILALPNNIPFDVRYLLAKYLRSSLHLWRGTKDFRSAKLQGTSTPTVKKCSGVCFEKLLCALANAVRGTKNLPSKRQHAQNEHTSREEVHISKRRAGTKGFLSECRTMQPRRSATTTIHAAFARSISKTCFAHSQASYVGRRIFVRSTRMQGMSTPSR